MDIRDKKQNNRKDQASKITKEGHGVLDPSEVKQYEKGRKKKGSRFGKKWFPENKKD